jgi:hypothetical protein
MVMGIQAFVTDAQPKDGYKHLTPTLTDSLAFGNYYGIL